MSWERRLSVASAGIVIGSFFEIAYDKEDGYHAR